MKKIALTVVVALVWTQAVLADTALKPGGDINNAAGWTNGLPSPTNPGTIAVDGINGTTVFGYGAGAVVTQTAGSINCTDGFNTLNGVTWNMSGGQILSRYILSNGANSIVNFSGGQWILKDVTGNQHMGVANGASLTISGSAIIDATQATQVVQTGGTINVLSGWTGTWTYGTHSGTAWRDLFTMNTALKVDGVNIDGPTFDAKFRVTPDGKTLSMVGPAKAREPNPEDGATDVPREVALGWTAGEYANTHNVYLGTNRNDVNQAGTSDPRAVLVSPSQTETTYTPATRLEFSTTYYWRIDEVNAPPSSTIFKGNLWSFTTEPVAYPVDGKTITATASSAEANQGPVNTINGSGLTNDLHGNDLATMWLTASGAAGPAWIQYEFAQPIKLHQMWVWNHDGMMETIIGVGAKDVTVTYSLDGTNFQTLGTTRQFARASAKPDYTHNTVVDFAGIAAKYVKLTIQSNWGGLLPQYGLSEVRFFSIPVVARQPSPAPGTANLDPHVTVSWRPGREAGSHQIFLGTDPNQLALAATVQKATYAADLHLDQTYYWKIVEVNQAQDPASWAGAVWSFSTAKSLVLDDFERYTDEDGKAIWQTWLDGYGVATNGSQVGNANPPYAELTFFHGGKQAMPLFYDNTAGATYSEATRTFDSPQDWTKYGIKGLTLWFLGDSANTIGTFYLKINNTKVLYDGAAADLQSKPWRMWYVDLGSLTGVNLRQVTKLTIGLEGGKGVLYLDDIALSPKSREIVTPVQPAATGLLVRYAFEGNPNDSAGTRNLTVTGAPQYAPGHLGQAIVFNGTGDFATVATTLNLPEYTVGVWFRVDGGTGSRDILSSYGATGGHGIMLEITSTGILRYLHRSPLGGSGGWELSTTTPHADGGWYHVAAVRSANTMALYLNGELVNSRTDTTAFNAALTQLTLGVLMHNNLTRFFPGALDEFCLYDRALSAAEVAGLAGRTVPFTKSF